MNGSVGQRQKSRVRAVGRSALAIAVLVVGTLVTSADGVPASAAHSTSAYVAIAPYRLADTRRADCGCTRLDPATIEVPVSGRPGVPPDAVAVSVTITATETATPGYVTLYPGGTSRPLVSVLNTRPDRPVANSAIIALGVDGTIERYENVPGDLIVDITGAFVAAASATAGRFVPVATRRLLDTREPGPSTGALAAAGEITVPLPDGVAADASAVAINVTSVGERLPGYLSARPAGTPLQVTSFLNTNGSGQAVAATTIVPVSPSGVTLYSHGGGHVVVDFLGWFTGASAADSSDGLFVPIGPQRALDTRETPPRAWPGGRVELSNSFPGAGALVTNVTATRSDRAGFVTAYPSATSRPNTSTLNPAMFEHTVANLAITQLSNAGLSYYSHAGNDIVVDVTGMFTGTPVVGTAVELESHPPHSRVLLVGDSTLAAVSQLYPQSKRAFVGFDGIVDAASCRRLLRPSCKSAVTHLVPNTAVEAILGTPGTIDVLVVKTGYNDWNSDFPAEFDAVVRAGRAKGAHQVLWLSYTESQTSPKSRQAYQENNADLYHLVTLPQYSDVVLADWRAYTAGIGYWTWDGSHLTEAGSWLQTDFVSRWIAAIEHRPCPAPWGSGGPIYDPCPPPESIGPVPDVSALY
jgi:hypothetical protein